MLKIFPVLAACAICWLSLAGCSDTTAKCSTDSDCPDGTCVDGRCQIKSDRDGDGIDDFSDNCPEHPNPDQADSDGDGIGDVCDPCPNSGAIDSDGDGKCDDEDNCPADINADQADRDSDGVGDVCDPCPDDNPDDSDNDSVCDSVDNCVADENTAQTDSDSDGSGDVCDPCPHDAADDSDSDGHCADVDNCPTDSNPDQIDSDGDGIGDVCDPSDDSFREDGPTNPDCIYQPERARFDPREEIGWSGSDLYPDKDQVMSTPVVVNLNDDNGDQLVNEDDIPDIVFNAFSVSGDPPILGSGVLRAISGDTFTDLWAVAPGIMTTAPAASVAAGDIDNDGLVELVTLRYQGGLVAFEHTGELKWSCADFGADNCIDYADLHAGNEWGGPAIADLDQDGTPEIILGAAVYRANGELWWEGSNGIGDNGVGPLSAICNLDRDGHPEVVTGSTAYHYDGSLYWNNGLSDGFVAIGEFDSDDYPEIVVVADGNIRLQEHDGTLAWGPFALPGSGRGGPPTVADFDGDGQPEIGVADHDTYVLFETDGSIKWSKPTQDHSSSATGSSVFDFEDDGYAEVVYNDETTLRIYDGATGDVIFDEANSSFTAYEYPLIVDVDNDGNAEIVVCANDFMSGTHTGIRVFGDLEDNWVRTRRIWNQHTYHITNVSESGAIPQTEAEGWLEFNSYRQNELATGEGLATSAPDLAGVEGSQIASGCPDQIVLYVWVQNQGAISAPAGIPSAFYSGDPDAGGTLIDVVYTTRILQPGQAQRVFLTWTDPPLGSNVSVYVLVDDFGTGKGAVNECGDDSNNIAIIENVGCP
ncbi:MAG: VCBS repeat-containing protein [Deltaproteobacteria bacterium]|nr:VCBS repeat-containing protein [Deltaproteobacteria bacterium]